MWREVVLENILHVLMMVRYFITKICSNIFFTNCILYELYLFPDCFGDLILSLEYLAIFDLMRDSLTRGLR